MKLLLCNSCEDIVKLSKTTRTCQCGATGGHYKEDGVNAIYYGPATTIGFTNSEFKYALDNRPRYGSGVEFTAFVIPDNVPTITHVDLDDYVLITYSEYLDLVQSKRVQYQITLKKDDQ